MLASDNVLLLSISKSHPESSMESSMCRRPFDSVLPRSEQYRKLSAKSTDSRRNEFTDCSRFRRCVRAPRGKRLPYRPLGESPFGRGFFESILFSGLLRLVRPL